MDDDEPAAKPATGAGLGFASAVRSSRRRACLTQEELAQLSGLSVRTIRNLELGRIWRPHADSVRLLADALGMKGPARKAFVDLAAGRGAMPATGDLPPVVRQLPPDLGTFFTGRQLELDVLGELLERTGETEQQTAPAVVAITGVAGVGKSALAIHAAHRVAGRFPDGQLYANLHGATPGLAPLSPEEVLSRFLRALGTEDRFVPHQVEEAAAQFRSLVEGKRLLLLLDDVTSAAQVRPLIPASPVSALLLTSRHALFALDGATHLRLDVLASAAAVDLLCRLAGHRRVMLEPEAAISIARSCGNLPLALRIAGARLAARPDWSVRSLAERLADERRRLDTLQVGDLAVRTSFQVSYRLLPPAAEAGREAPGRALALLALMDGPDVGLPAAAALLDQPEPAAEATLEQLLDANLLQTLAPGRYRMHDLVRLFARELCTRDEPAAERRAAVLRALQWYLRASRCAARLLQPGGRADGADDESPAGVAFAGRPEALAWLDAERANLVAGARQAADADADAELQALAGELTKALFWYLYLRKDWPEWEALNRRAVEIASRRDDPAAASHALVTLGIIAQQRQHFDEAVGYLEGGLSLRRQVGDRQGEGRALDALGVTHRQAGRLDLAILSYRGSLDACRETGDRLGQAMVLGNLGIVHGEAGRPEEAVEHFHQSLAICRELGDRYVQGWCRSRLAIVYLHNGQSAEAHREVQHCLDICRELKDEYTEALALRTLGDVHRGAGRRTEAITAYRRSLEICAAIGHRVGEAEARQRLDEIGDTEP
jgi:tetratricopeptide (TPR) repeat protein/transcriptional regulator with XRE-family HTH domain